MKKEKSFFFHSTIRRMIRDTRPIWKWLLLSCLLSVGIIACSILPPGECPQE